MAHDDTGLSPLLLDPPTTARMLGVSTRQLRRLVQLRELRAVKIGRRTYYRTSDVGAYVAALSDAADVNAARAAASAGA